MSLNIPEDGLSILAENVRRMYLFTKFLMFPSYIAVRKIQVQLCTISIFDLYINQRRKVHFECFYLIKMMKFESTLPVRIKVLGYCKVIAIK